MTNLPPAKVIEIEVKKKKIEEKKKLKEQYKAELMADRELD